MDFGEALRRENNRRAITQKFKSTPEGEGFTAFGVNDSEADEAAKLLAEIVTKRVNRQLKPKISTKFEDQEDATEQTD